LASTTTTLANPSPATAFCTTPATLAPSLLLVIQLHPFSFCCPGSSRLQSSSVAIIIIIGSIIFKGIACCICFCSMLLLLLLLCCPYEAGIKEMLHMCCCLLARLQACSAESTAAR
jgi:hypothetical protein